MAGGCGSVYRLEFESPEHYAYVLASGQGVAGIHVTLEAVDPNGRRGTGPWSPDTDPASLSTLEFHNGYRTGPSEGDHSAPMTTAHGRRHGWRRECLAAGRPSRPHVPGTPQSQGAPTRPDAVDDGWGGEGHGHMRPGGRGLSRGSWVCKNTGENVHGAARGDVLRCADPTGDGEADCVGPGTIIECGDTRCHTIRRASGAEEWSRIPTRLHANIDSDAIGGC